jgi:hypothetical protein
VEIRRTREQLQVVGHLEADQEAGVVLAGAGRSRRRASSTSVPNKAHCLGVWFAGSADLLRDLASVGWSFGR